MAEITASNGTKFDFAIEKESIDGEALCELCLDDGTVDNTYPTDFGIASIAKAVCEVIEKIGL